MNWRRLALEWLLLRRQGAVRIGVPVLFIAGLLAMYHGGELIARQRAVLREAPARQAAAHEAILRSQRDALAGDQLYYLAFETQRHPSAWAPLALGQRDVHAYNLDVRIHALQGQLYDAELDNPLLASFGSFDLAFVVVVLAPLLLIALTWNLWSGEAEQGTLSLLRAQARSVRNLFVLRLSLRAGVAWFTVFSLVVCATLWLSLPVDRTWWAIQAVLFGYLMGWAVVAGLVALARRPSEFNLMLLLAIWLIGTALGPAGVNVMAGRRFPAPEALELTVAQRQGYHAAWDEPLSEVMASFYQRYPEWRSVPVPSDRYSNAWYYAMQQRGDDAAHESAVRYRSALVAREQWSQRWLWLFPPAVVHAQLSALARTDQAAYLRYLDSVAEYHERLKAHFFPVVFSSQRVSDVDWAKAPAHQHLD